MGPIIRAVKKERMLGRAEYYYHAPAGRHGGAEADDERPRRLLSAMMPTGASKARISVRLSTLPLSRNCRFTCRFRGMKVRQRGAACRNAISIGGTRAGHHIYASAQIAVFSDEAAVCHGEKSPRQQWQRALSPLGRPTIYRHLRIG